MTPQLSTRQRLQGYVDAVASSRKDDELIPDVQVCPVTPVPKPRMTQKDKWEKRDAVLRYRAYADELRLRGIKLPHAYFVQFVLPMPDSWPDEIKEQLNNQLHMLKPDTSNLIKAIEDAVVKNDERLHSLGATKRWGYAGSITITKFHLGLPVGSEVKQ